MEVLQDMREYSIQNKKAWEYNAYEFWIQQSGSPEKRAQKDIENPIGMLKKYSKYFDNYQGVRVANICGSCGKKAIPLDILGAEVTIFDISEDNKRYAMEVAEAAKVNINFEVGDVLEINMEKYAGYFDVIFMEGGVLHYFHDINQFMQIMFALLKTNGKMICRDFHPFSKIADMLNLQQPTMNYFSTEVFEGEMAHARFFEKEIKKEMPKCSYRKYTVSEIINAVIENGFILKRFDEHPSWENEKIPGEFTIVAKKETGMTDFERTFDNTAIGYDKSRPSYVNEIYNDIFKYKQINSESNVLEIGMGTGKASKPILDTKCHLIGIEPGENLAALAKAKYKNYTNCSIYTQTLQDYVCPDESFDLIYSATAFHWIPEEYGYRRVYDLLKSGGIFARFAYHAGTDKKRRAMMEEIQELYRKYMDSTRAPKEFDFDDAKGLAEIAKKYGFVDIEYKVYHVTKDFTAEEYMELLKTYPDHMNLEEKSRKMLFDGSYDAINRHGGVITVYYTMDLELARKAL